MKICQKMKIMSKLKMTLKKEDEPKHGKDAKIEDTPFSHSLAGPVEGCRVQFRWAHSRLQGPSARKSPEKQEEIQVKTAAIGWF